MKKITADKDGSARALGPNVAGAGDAVVEKTAAGLKITADKDGSARALGPDVAGADVAVVERRTAVGLAVDAPNDFR